MHQVPLSSCDYFVDVDLEEVSENEPRIASLPGWSAVYCEPFLDAQHSDPLLRAFYIPYLSESRTSMRPYCLYKRE